jgi:multiple sugar transport system substrate-binding protein
MATCFWLSRTLAEFANQGNKFHLPFYSGPLAEIDTEGTRRENFPAGEFCVWALGSMKPDSIARGVDWCTKARSYMPPRRSALEAGKAAFDSGFLKTFTDEIYPGARAEPRMPPPVYRAISDAIQACQLNGQNPWNAAAAASEQIDAFLASYKGAPIL